MKKTYKEEFDKICLDKKMDEIILNKTIYKSQNNLLKIVVVTLSILLFISITSIGIVYAKEIVEKIKSLIVKTTIDFDDEEWGDIHLTKFKVSNRKDVNVDAEFPNVNFPVTDSEQKISFKEIEENLEIEILASKLFENDVARIIKLEKSNDKISHGDFVFDDVYKTKKGKISMVIEFITEYYEEEYLSILLGQTRNLDKEYNAVEKIEKLNTDLYVWCPRKVQNNSEIVRSTLKAIFIYDNIVYTFTGDNISVDEILNVIDTLAYKNN